MRLTLSYHVRVLADYGILADFGILADLTILTDFGILVDLTILAVLPDLDGDRQLDTESDTTSM